MAMISALCTRRSTSETTQAALGKTSPHSAKGRLVVMTIEPDSPLRTWPPSSTACLKVIQVGEAKPRAMASDHSSSTFMPEYGSPV